MHNLYRLVLVPPHVQEVICEVVMCREINHNELNQV
jgi:hypothetical protein